MVVGGDLSPFVGRELDSNSDRGKGSQGETSPSFSVFEGSLGEIYSDSLGSSADICESFAKMV